MGDRRRPARRGSGAHDPSNAIPHGTAAEAGGATGAAAAPDPAAPGHVDEYLHAWEGGPARRTREFAAATDRAGTRARVLVAAGASADVEALIYWASAEPARNMRAPAGARRGRKPSAREVRAPGSSSCSRRSRPAHRPVRRLATAVACRDRQTDRIAAHEQARDLVGPVDAEDDGRCCCCRRRRARKLIGREGSRTAGRRGRGSRHRRPRRPGRRPSRHESGSPSRGPLENRRAPRAVLSITRTAPARITGRVTVPPTSRRRGAGVTCACVAN